ncbi:hypothetical protein AGMMS49992_26860 [Clostridia bacterium]|nr:hypothetical protein AGMMS49992_26860 [Clostridia bacterium]
MSDPNVLTAQGTGHISSRKAPTPYRTSICWNCVRATRGTARRVGLDWCSWAKAFMPVEGWEAEYKPIRSGSGEKCMYDSYMVCKCPLFCHDPPVRGYIAPTTPRIKLTTN